MEISSKISTEATCTCIRLGLALPVLFALKFALGSMLLAIYVTGCILGILSVTVKVTLVDKYIS